MSRPARYDRDAALDAAMAVFWEKGYHATSLKDLEDALAMKPGSIYAAFTSKQNLYLLALERYFEASRASFEASVKAAPSPLQGLAEHFRTYARLPSDDPARQACMLTKTLVDTRNTDPEIVARTKTYLAEMREAFSEAFRAAIARGELAQTADPDRLARRFQANVTALRLELHQGTSAQDVQTLAEDMALELEALRID